MFGRLYKHKNNSIMWEKLCNIVLRVGKQLSEMEQYELAATAGAEVERFLNEWNDIIESQQWLQRNESEHLNDDPRIEFTRIEISSLHFKVSKDNHVFEVTIENAVTYATFDAVCDITVRDKTTRKKHVKNKSNLRYTADIITKLIEPSILSYNDYMEAIVASLTSI